MPVGYTILLLSEKQSRGNQCNEASRLMKMHQKSSALSIRFECEEVSCKLKSLHCQQKTTTSLWKLERKGNWRKRKCGHRLIMNSITRRGGGGDVRRSERGGGAGSFAQTYIWAGWNSMTMHINFQLLIKKGIFTYVDLNPRDNRNQVMCRWSSQITSDYTDYPLNPSRLVSPPPPLRLLPLFS